MKASIQADDTKAHCRCLVAVMCMDKKGQDCSRMHGGLKQLPTLVRHV